MSDLGLKVKLTFCTYLYSCQIKMPHPINAISCGRYQGGAQNCKIFFISMKTATFSHKNSIHMT